MKVPPDAEHFAGGGVMRAALVYPYRKRDSSGCNPPLSLLYLAASLEKAGHDVLVVDSDDGDLTHQGILKRLVSYSPDVVGLPIYTTNLAAAYRLATLLGSEDFGWELLLGGPHVTARPQEVLESFTGCKYALRGECETTIVEFMEFLEGRHDPTSVEGLSYRDNGNIIHYGGVPLERDLDSVSFPARNLLADAYKRNIYWRIGHRGATDVIITSRGCPYDCNFCFQISRKFRLRSPENILEELIHIRSMGIKNVHMMDDLFVWDKERCLRILQMIREQKLGMEFKVRARVDLIDDDLLAAMKETGVVSVVYGIESGSQKILDLMNKRTTVEMNYRAIEMTKRHGLQAYADAFIGYPGETPETIEETRNLLVKARPTAVNLSVMYPLPNTTVYDQTKADGTMIGDWDVKGTRPWIKLPWTENLGQLWAYRAEVERSFLHNPVVIFNILRTLAFKISLRQIRLLATDYLKRISVR
jgi:anaerobic magnesium-protoporphyrin IX monomethyl ester cyclase